MHALFMPVASHSRGAASKEALPIAAFYAHHSRDEVMHQLQNANPTELKVLVVALQQQLADTLFLHLDTPAARRIPLSQLKLPRSPTKLPSQVCTQHTHTHTHTHIHTHTYTEIAAVAISRLFGFATGANRERKSLRASPALSASPASLALTHTSTSTHIYYSLSSQPPLL
jgi:hypothetical protein